MRAEGTGAAASLGHMPAPEPEPRPRAPRSRTSEALDLLRRNRDFRLMFVAQLISLGGDWFLSVALFGLVFEFTGSPALVSALIATMSVPYAVMTFVGGPLADRIDRRRLMVASDVVRGVLAFGFFFVTSSTVWLAFVLVGVIQSLGAFFEPAAAAAVPNLVEPEDLPVANVLTGSLWGTMLAVGAALGGVVVAAFGRKAGYIGDAASFLVSAALMVQNYTAGSPSHGRTWFTPGCSRRPGRPCRTPVATRAWHR